MAEQYRKRPVVIEAVRYGKDEDGRWYPGAVQRVAQFMLGEKPDVQLSDGRIIDVLRPASGPWDPPELAELQMFDGIAHHAWLPLSPGDWVIRGVQNEFYPCKPDIFAQTYETVAERPQRLTADELAVCIDVALYGAPSVYTAPEMFMPRRDLISATIKANPLIAGI